MSRKVAVIDVNELLEMLSGLTDKNMPPERLLRGLCSSATTSVRSALEAVLLLEDAPKQFGDDYPKGVVDLIEVKKLRMVIYDAAECLNKMLIPQNAEEIKLQREYLEEIDKKRLELADEISPDHVFKGGMH